MSIVKISNLPLVDQPVEGTDLFVVVQDDVTKKAYASDIQTYVGFEEVQYATAGQTVFNLTTMTYAAGANNLMVFVDGVNQYEGLSYTETDNNTVTFTQGLHVGAVVKFSTVQTQTSLVNSAGAVTFLAAGTGAVARSVQSKERDIVSVKDFGAVGDGVTNDAAAIQAAVNSGATTIVFPKGVYLVNSQIVLPFLELLSTYPQISLIGYNARIVTGTNSPLFVSGSGTSPGDIRSSGYIFDGFVFQAAPGVAGIIFDNTLIRFRVQNCIFSYIEIAFYGGADPNVDYFQTVYIQNNIFYGCEKVIYGARAYDINFQFNMVEGCGDGIILEGASDPVVNMLRIENNVMQGMGGQPISLGGAFGATISHNYFERNSSPVKKCYIDLSYGTATNRGIVIANNSFDLFPAQNSDVAFNPIKLSNVANNQSDRPAIFGNVSTGSQPIADGGFGVYFSNFAANSPNTASAPNIQNPNAYKISYNGSFFNNKAVAFDGVDTWKLIEISNITSNATLNFIGTLSLKNSGANTLGRTYIKFSIGIEVDGDNAVNATVLSQVELASSSGDVTSGTPYYGSYWNSGGTSQISVSVSTGVVTVSINKFNDYSFPSYGKVVSLTPSLGVDVGSNGYQNLSIGVPE